MPQPRQQQPQGAPSGAAAAGAVAPFVGAEVAPAAAAGLAALGLAAGAGLTAKGLIEALERLSQVRFDAAWVFVAAELAREHPDLGDSEKRGLLAQERLFEKEFRRKMRQRLKRDLPKAFAITDPSQRLDAIKAIFEREKHYTLQREQAMLLRSLGRAEAFLLKRLSAEGAYWKLSPHVKEHTLDCLAMGEKFWPWSVLERFQPPVHHGCQCYLLGLDEAIQAGLMTADQVPDPEDAEKRAKKLLADAHDAMEEIPEEDLRDWMEEAARFYAEADADNVVSLEEVRGHHKPRRYQKGLIKGGQFMPERGGMSARTRRTLRDLLRPEPPTRGRSRGKGQWRWLNGRYTRVPAEDRWERKIGGRRYTSPAGSTYVYKDGRPVETPERARMSPGVVAPAAPPGEVNELERRRADIRAEHAADIRLAVMAGRSPLSDGDPASRILAMEAAGFRMEGVEPVQQGQRLYWRHREERSAVSAVFDGEAIQEVEWIAAPDVALPRRELRRPPKDFHEFTQDALSWADELGERYGAEVHLPEVRMNPRLGDHAGQHLWTGEAELGRDTPSDIARAAESRAAGRALRDDELRGLYSSYWVAAHEISHGVNPIDPHMFHGGEANLEEALAEEVSHILAVTRLQETGQTDVLDWRDRNPNAIAVRGNYLRERNALGTLLDQAGITEPLERRQAVLDLKFKVAPEERMAVLAQQLKATHPDFSLDQLLTHVDVSMTEPEPVEGPALPRQSRSPGRAQTGPTYAKFRDGWMARDGNTLFLPNGGMRRVERLPVVPPWDQAEPPLEGWAVAHYGPGQTPTSDERYEDGTLKSYRYVDSEDRAKLILRAFLGKGSPGDSGADDRDDAVERLARLRNGGWEWVSGVPVKRRYDGSYGVGWAVDDARTLSPTIRDPKAAADLAFKGGWGFGTRASPGVLTTASLAEALDGWVDPVTGVRTETRVDGWGDGDAVFGRYVAPDGSSAGWFMRGVGKDGSVRLGENKIDEKWQRQGIGSRFLAHTEVAAIQLGAPSIRAIGESEAGKGYLLKAGFKSVMGSGMHERFEKLLAKASPGTEPGPEPPQSLGDMSDKAKKLLGDLFGPAAAGPGLPPEEEQIVKDAFVASEVKKPSPPKGPPDKFKGKKLGNPAATPKFGLEDPIPDYSATELTLGKGAGGTQGARWAFDEQENRWLVKHYKGNQDRVATELLANAIYRAVGVKAATAGTTVWPTGVPDFAGVPDADIDEPPLPDTDKRISTGVIVMEDDGRFWLIEPRGKFGGYDYTYPKGGLEEGLTGQQNAYKELYEEAGLRAEVTGFLGDFEGDTSVTRYYVARRTGGSPEVSDETEGVHLVTAEEAAEMLNRQRDQDVLEALGQITVPPASGAPLPDLPEATQVALTYPTLEGEVREHFKPSAQVGQGFMTDALVGNWDFVGATGDNILWGTDGEPIRLDQGGTFELRAMGGTKPFGPVPSEVWTMLEKGQGKRGVLITEDEQRAQAKQIGDALTDDVIDAAVSAAPFADEPMRERIRENLKARTQWMRDYAAGTVDVPKPAEGDDARDVLAAQSSIELFPEQEDSLFAYAEGMRKEINGALRDKNVKIADASKPVRKAVEELDSLLRHSKTGGDVIAYVGVGGDPSKGSDLVGKTLRERAYLEAVLNPEDLENPVLLRLTVPAGSHMLHPEALGYEDFPASPELLLARDADIKIAKAERTSEGRLILHATVATKAAYKPYKGGGGGGGSGGAWKPAGGGKKPSPWIPKGGGGGQMSL